MPDLTRVLSAARNAAVFEREWAKELALLPEVLGGSRGHCRRRRPSLLRALIRAFGTGSGGRLWVVLAVATVFCAAVTSSPFFVGRLVRYFQGVEPQYVLDNQVPTGYVWALGVFACFAVVSCCVTQVYVNTTRMGHMARLAIITGVYRKSLRLSATVGKEGGSAYVNLMTVDAERVWLGFLKCHLGWATCVVILVGCVELYVTAGPAGLAAVAVLLCFLPAQGYVARALGQTRRAMSAATDARVQLQSELLSGIRVVKAYGWESLLEAQVAALRAVESRHLRRLLLLRAANQTMTFLAPSMAMGAVFLLYSLDAPLDETIVFTSLAILSVIRPPLLSIPKAVDIYAEFFVSIRRIQEFLLLEEKPAVAALPPPPQAPEAAAATSGSEPQQRRRQFAVSLLGASFSWSQAAHSVSGFVGNSTGGTSVATAADNGTFALRDIQLQIRKGSLTCIVGSVGSGKTSLLLALLGELNALKGGNASSGEGFTLQGRVAFAGQQPWIQNASIKHGILFEQSGSGGGGGAAAATELRYQTAILSAQLKPDLKMLIDGDATVIGDRGVNLSGGQKQRVALARVLACADTHDVFVLDDVLSAVDVDVADAIVREALLGVLAGKTRIVSLNSHYHVLSHADLVVVMDGGRIAGKGTYEEMLQEFGPLIDPHSGGSSDGSADHKQGHQGAAAPPQAPSLEAATETAVDHALMTATVAAAAVSEDKQVAETVATSAEDVTVSAAAATHAAAPHPCDCNASSASPVALTKSASTKAATTQELYAAEQRRVGVLDLSLYREYFAAGCCGLGTLALFVILLLTILAQVLCVLADWWLSRWSQASRIASASSAVAVNGTAVPATEPGDGLSAVAAMRTQELTREAREEAVYWRATYAAFLPAIAVAGSLRALVFVFVSFRAAKTIHAASMARVLRGPLPTFFDVTPVGRLVNRFSKDQDSLDAALPAMLSEFLESCVFLLSIVVLCGVNAPVFLVAMVPLSFLFYRFRAFFSASSRELKRMQATTRSPLYSMLSETLDGLSHLRAFGLASAFSRRFDAMANRNAKQFYYSYILIPYMILRMDILGACLILAVSCALVLFRDTVSAAAAGLAIAYALQIMGRLQMTVTVSIETENHMVAVERLRELGTMPQESDVHTPAAADAAAGANRSLIKPTEDWPREGRISVRGAKVRYRKGLPLVVKGVTVEIPAGASVGVCGRTGSGKSTLLSALLRLVELEDGAW